MGGERIRAGPGTDGTDGSRSTSMANLVQLGHSGPFDAALLMLDASQHTATVYTR